MVLLQIDVQRFAVLRFKGDTPRAVHVDRIAPGRAAHRVKIEPGGAAHHPKLRIGFLDSGGGWVAPWLDRMDRHFDDQGFNDSGLKTRPSELFQRNCWISFEPVEGCIKVLADYIGPHKILW